LAGDESSLLGGRLNETIESDINTSKNDATETRTKGLTFGNEKKIIKSNKILGEEFQEGMNTEYGRISEMRGRQARNGGNVSNDFEPTKMTNGNNQDTQGVHREVIYDQNQVIKDRNGKAKVIRYSGNNNGPSDLNHINKTNSVSTKIEHRVVFKNGGDEGAENFGSSKYLKK
jgi:hypothetical protein